MRAVLHLPAHDRSAGHADALAPGDELGRRPFAVRAVRCRHVLGVGREGAPDGAVGVHRHALLAGEGLHRRAADAQLDLGAHQPVRHAVVVAVELDVVVDVHARALEAHDGHAARRQRPQRRLIQPPEGLAAAAGQLLERARVQVGDELADRRVELGQAEEAAVAQAREDPSFDHEHRALDLRLVPRMRGPGR